MRDDAVIRHLNGRVLGLGIRVDPGADAFQGRDRRQRSGDPARLVGRQRVHRVDQDRLDPRLALLLAAMLEDRPEVGLGLTGPRSGRH